MKISFIGLGGVPFSKRATDVRLSSFVDLFQSLGHEVEIINRFSNIKNSNNYPYHIYEPYKKTIASNKMVFILVYFLSLIKEPFAIIKSNKKKHIDILFNNSAHFIDIFIYFIISKIIKAKLIHQYCEFRSVFENRSIYHNINGRLVDKVSPKLWDGAICISHFLEDSCKSINPKLKTIKVYPICDFDYFDSIQPKNIQKKYILYCGSCDYIEVINFIIKSYNKSLCKSSFDLIMVIRGNQNIIEQLKQQNPNITFLEKLEYSDLISWYKSASALLIPMRDNIRDLARYPNKICEYCASSGIIITTNYGEIPYLFKNEYNALISKEYSTDSFAEELNKLENNDAIIKSIKENAYITGKKHFETSAYKESMNTFLHEL